MIGFHGCQGLYRQRRSPLRWPCGTEYGHWHSRQCTECMERERFLRPPVAEISQELRSSETSGLPSGEPRRLRMRDSAFPVSPGLAPMASPCRFRPFRPESTAFSRRDHYRLRSGSSVWLPGRLRPSSRHGSLSEADASSESLLRRLSRDPAEPRLADPPASLPSLRSGNEGKRKTGRADFALPGVSPGRTPVSLRSDSPATLTRPGGIVGRSQPIDL